MGMFVPMLATVPCVKGYVRNEPNARWQLNAIPLRRNGETSWTVYFPRPFQIIGLCQSPISNLPSTDDPVPSWPMIYPTPESPVFQANYSNITPLLMLELAIATIREQTDDVFVQYPVVYIDGGIQKVNFRGYFTKYLNDSLMATPEQWFNSFMMPAAMWKTFADNNSITPADVWMQRFYEFIEFIQKSSDQRLFGAPGVYAIQESNPSYSWATEQEYKFIVEG